MQILSQETASVAAIITAVVALSAFVLSWKAYKSTQWKEIAKQKDLDRTNKSVMDHDKRIGDIEKGHPFKAYVDQQDRSIHKRIDGIEKRSDENIKDLHCDVKEILKILAK